MSQMNDYPELILTKSKQGHDGQKKFDMITNIPINAVVLVMQNSNESSINYQKKNNLSNDDDSCVCAFM